MNKLVLFLLFTLVLAIEQPKKETKANIDFIVVIKCILGHEELIDDVHTIIDLIKAGDYIKVISAVYQLYTDGIFAIKECLAPKEIISLNNGWKSCIHCCKGEHFFKNCVKKCEEKQKK